MSTVGASGLPLYRRIEADLRDRIRSGGLRPAPRSRPSRSSWRSTASAGRRSDRRWPASSRRACSRSGAGSARTSPAPRFEHTIGGFYSFSREIERHGLPPGTKVLDLRTEPAGDDVAEALAIEPGTAVIALRRLRLAGPDPLVVETSHLPAARFPGLEDVDFSPVRLYDTLLTPTAAARRGRGRRSSRSC